MRNGIHFTVDDSMQRNGGDIARPLSNPSHLRSHRN